MHLLREIWYCIDLSQTGQILPLVCPEFFVINDITVLFFSEANGKEFARNTFKTLEIVRAAFERMPYFFTDDNHYFMVSPYTTSPIDLLFVT